MNTLYISDLDGTLLNEHSELSGYTLETLNRLIENGLQFAVATARTAFSTEFVLRGLNLKLPAIQMNGACLYDFAEHKILDVQYIPESALAAISTLSRRFDILPLVYVVRGGVQTTYYERVTSPAMREFLDFRVLKYDQIIPNVERFETLFDNGVMYFCFADTKERLTPLAALSERIPGILTACYRDVAIDGDVWLLELFSETASKANGLKRLRQYGRFDRIVGFGDNLNDLPLFAGCDECYAVANAHDAVKAAATAVIGSNTDDGVARWLERNA